MKIKVSLPAAILFMLLTLPGWSFDTRPFLPPPRVKAPKSLLQLPALPKVSREPEPSIQERNEAARLNNEALQALSEGRVSRGIDLLGLATRSDPNNVKILNNLLSAKQKSSNPREVVELGKKIMAMGSTDYFAPYTVGIALSEKLQKSEDAIAFLGLARKLKPDDPHINIALAVALEKCGYTRSALKILEKFPPQMADDPYPMYLLGRLSLAQGDFDRAEQALSQVLPLDKEGYIHEALARCRFLMGNINGLADFARRTIQRFPNIDNKKTLERIYFSLIPKKITFIEKITASISSSKDLINLTFRTSPPPTIPGKQSVALRSAKIFSKGKVSPVEALPAKGKLRIVCPPELFSNEVSVAMEYEINLQPCIGGWAISGSDSKFQLSELQKQPIFSLKDSRLRILAEKIERIPGDYLRNAFTAVGRGLKYKENAVMQPVSWTLSNLNDCDCTEFTGLLCSLYLLRNIPARMSIGFLLKPEFRNQETEIGHAWCQVYIGPQGWTPIDPTLGADWHFSSFGNSLADQILFENDHRPESPRHEVDLLSSTSIGAVDLKNSYKFDL